MVLHLCILFYASCDHNIIRRDMKILGAKKLQNHRRPAQKSMPLDNVIHSNEANLYSCSHSASSHPWKFEFKFPTTEPKRYFSPHKIIHTFFFFCFWSEGKSPAECETWNPDHTLQAQFWFRIWWPFKFLWAFKRSLGLFYIYFFCLDLPSIGIK